MSHAALASVLHLDDVSVGERLAAFSLASFANRDHRAWPSTPVAAARAGLSRSQYLAARGGLARRGLVEVEASGGGRGRSAVVWLRFAELGPWADVDVNPRLVEAVLTHSRAAGAARVLLATLAAVADEHGTAAELSTRELQAAAGIADSTYRRARTTLLASGELVLASAGGGRARTNRWSVPDPRTVNPSPVAITRPRTAPNAGARPLLANARPSTQPRTASEEQLRMANAVEARSHKEPGVGPCAAAAVSNPGHDRTVSPRKGPNVNGVSGVIPAQIRTVFRKNGPRSTGVYERNPGQDRTAYRKTPPQTPPETPPPNARAGRESQNPEPGNPPDPPEGGRDGTVSIIDDYVTASGRRRRRTTVVELEQARSRLFSPTPGDHADWRCIRSVLESALGSEKFAIWLAPLQLMGCDDSVLLLACPAETRRWVSGRFASQLERASGSVGRRARLSTDSELQLYRAVQAATSTPHQPLVSDHDQEAV